VNWDKVYDTIINKFHIVLATACQGAIIVYHFKTGHDIGNGVQNTVYAFYAFLTGHAATYQKWPDKDGQ
jgi:hypothetical protein